MSSIQAQSTIAFPRRLWRLLEPLHAVTYFAQESSEEFARCGLRGAVMSYVAGRTAALGPVDGAVAAAVLFSFHPRFVARVVPRAWSLATPEDVVAARFRGVDRALRRVWGVGTATSDEVGGLAEEIECYLWTCSVASRPMFAAHRSLAPPSEPHLRLWHAATLLREHRGDGHAAILLANGVDACQAHMMVVGTTTLGTAWLPFRGYSAADCSAARLLLQERGWLDEAGRATAEGQRVWQRVEDLTDDAADAGRGASSPDQGSALLDRLQRLVTPLRAAGILPAPYPPVG